MKRIIFFIFLFVISITTISNVRAIISCFPPDSLLCGGGGTEPPFEVIIQGCFQDGSLCGECARNTAGYCQCDANGVGTIISDCRGPLGDGACATTCDQSVGEYCDISGAGTCESEGFGNCNSGAVDWNSCVADLGCYYDGTAGNEVCAECPPPGDKLCSDFKTENACNFDICGFGSDGPDSYLCSNEGINNCGCQWDTFNSVCGFGYTKYNPDTGLDIFCTLEQTFLSECDANTNKRTLQTTEICQGEAPKSLGTKEIDCGRALSPLPFFSMFSLILSLVLISSYYFFMNGRIK